MLRITERLTAADATAMRICYPAESWMQFRIIGAQLC